MAEYKSAETPIKASAEAVYNKLSNLEGLKELMARVPQDQIPDDQRDLFNQVKITSDTLSFPAGPVGELTLKLTETVEPTYIRLEGVGAPVPMALMLHIHPSTDVSCTAEVAVDLSIPPMLKPMVSGPLNKMVSQFADMLRQLPYD
ncbi:MAG: SRPBCC family protein [Bacteroidales bacterium]|nr:SRPBCC family protein [Bacteroidales bacterium]MDE6835953.1 SRPBCC family protein [Muribaculaceae bacterium]MDE6866433.1 SRPBCC family protein [Muribaculaceae bacterium]